MIDWGIENALSKVDKATADEIRMWIKKRERWYSFLLIIDPFVFNFIYNILESITK